MEEVLTLTTSVKLHNQKEKEKENDNWSNLKCVICIFTLIKLHLFSYPFLLKKIHIGCIWDKLILGNFFYYLTYFWYYSWISLLFLVLFIGHTVLFQLTFSSIVLSTKRFQVQLNKIFPNVPIVSLIWIHHDRRRRGRVWNFGTERLSTFCI